MVVTALLLLVPVLALLELELALPWAEIWVCKYETASLTSRV